MISYSHLLQLAMPEAIVVIAAILALIVDLGFLRNATLRTRLATCMVRRVRHAAAASRGQALRLVGRPLR